MGPGGCVDCSEGGISTVFLIIFGCLVVFFGLVWSIKVGGKKSQYMRTFSEQGKKVNGETGGLGGDLANAMDGVSADDRQPWPYLL
jgi:hypothetical protein